MNYYIEAPKMALKVKFFIINVIIRAQPYVYMKTKEEIFLGDMLLYLGKMKEIQF